MRVFRDGFLEVMEPRVLLVAALFGISAEDLRPVVEMAGDVGVGVGKVFDKDGALVLIVRFQETLGFGDGRIAACEFQIGAAEEGGVGNFRIALQSTLFKAFSTTASSSAAAALISLASFFLPRPETSFFSGCSYFVKFPMEAPSAIHVSRRAI